MNIQNIKIGKNFKTFLIAEVGLSHEGSLGLAFSMIDGAKEAGADAVKFQMHIADEESTLEEKFRSNVFIQHVLSMMQHNTKYEANKVTKTA